jgi:hypothetical protein
MKKLFVAAPMLVLAGALIVQSCSSTGDQGGVMGGGGHKGDGGKGEGGSGEGGMGTGGMGIGGMQMGMGGSNMGMGGMGTGGMDTGGMMGMGGMGDLKAVAAVLDGKMWTGPCLRDTQAAVCATVNGACPGANTAGSGLAGVLTTDKTYTLGGTPGTSYTITLHIQGEVESKQYTTGMDQDSTKTSPAADGFCIGGTPTNADAYNVYMLQVTNPNGGAVTKYYLNSLQQADTKGDRAGPGVSNHTTYGIDYTAQIKAMGGASIRTVAADSNCSMIKNCGPVVNDGNTCAGAIILNNIEPTAVAANPTFSFTTGYNGQWIVMTVKSVTSP